MIGGPGMIGGPVKDNFKGVGVFHFGSEDKERPIESLRAELKKLDSDVSGWLMVLPEGFNVVGGYPKGNPDQSIKMTLLEISESSRLAFVVGLIETDEKSRKFNLSCLLDGFETQHILSRKYDPRSPDEVPNPAFCAAPIVHRGLAISAGQSSHSDRKPQGTEAEGGVSLCSGPRHSGVT
jgi:hypothetical protein